MTHAIFSFGSNLDAKQMLRRCKELRIVTTGVLRNHQLVFAGWSGHWQSPVATAVPRAGSRVPGVIYEISDKGLAALDRCEGHPHVYRRESVLVHTRGGGRHRAQIYLLNAALPPAPPRSRYFLTILAAYREWGFNEEPLIRAALDL